MRRLLTIHFFLVVAVTTLITTAASADFLYNNVHFEVGDGGDGQTDWEFYDSNTTSFDVTYVDDFLGTSLSLIGDESGFSLTNDGYMDNWWVVLGIDFTFDVDTYVTVSVDYEGDPYELINTSLINPGEYLALADDPFGLGGYIHFLDVPGSYTLNVTFSEVPAPSAFALLGLAGFSTRRRKRTA